MPTTTKRPRTVCQCVDHGCPVHPGMECCRVQTDLQRIRRVYRIDMDDASGTPMCPQCASDALDSGVFTTTRSTGRVAMDDMGKRLDAALTKAKRIVAEHDQGAPNLDAMSSVQLMEFWHRNRGIHPRARAAAMFPDHSKGRVIALRDLANYASNKATAMMCRERGDIVTAIGYEAICERIYSRLPEWARW